VRDHVLYPYKTIGKVIILGVLVFSVLQS